MVNNHKNILLSVAIPTYNGAEHIGEALECISKQIVVRNFQDEVNITVSDNGSTDETAKIVKGYLIKYPFIHYFKNEQNLGIDENCDLAVERSNGNYVWLFGDDDLMKKGAVDKVMDIIKQNHDLSYIFVNFTLIQNLVNIKVNTYNSKIKRDLKLKNFREVFNLIYKQAGFLSTNIFLRSKYLDYKSSIISQSRFLEHFLALKDTNNVYYIIADGLIIERYQSRTVRGFKPWLLVIIGYLKILKVHGDHYKEIKMTINKSTIPLIKYILLAKALGLPISTNLWQEIWSVVPRNFYWVILKTIYFTPRVVFKLLYFVYNKFKPINKAAIFNLE